jgi:probable rRNA maturation factor
MIEINNLTTNPIDEEFFKKTAKMILKGENKKTTTRSPPSRKRAPANLSIALVGQGRISELNRRYRGKNRVTDILAFPNKEIGLGEIVICFREVKKNAKKYGLTFEKEFSKVLIHGIFHLLGYNHEESEKEAERMRQKEEYYLSQLETEINRRLIKG